MNTLLDVQVDEHVRKLTAPWSDVLSPKETGTGRYVPVDYPPLLDMLDEACRSNVGGVPSAGRTDPSARNLLNLEAHMLREHIDGTVRAWIRELSKERAAAELKSAVTQLSGVLHAHRSAGTIPDSEWERIARFFPRWCNRIWQLFDPPVVKELVGACPNCAETVHSSLDGSKTTAMIAYYWKGIQPEAKCQRCGERWEGERALLELGYHLGATVDEDALREMGVL